MSDKYEPLPDDYLDVAHIAQCRQQPDPFHAGRVLEKHYVRTMEETTYKQLYELDSTEHSIMANMMTMTAKNSIKLHDGLFCFSSLTCYIASKQHFDDAIASLIEKGLVRKVEVRLT